LPTWTFDPLGVAGLRFQLSHFRPKMGQLGSCKPPTSPARRLTLISFSIPHLGDALATRYQYSRES